MKRARAIALFVLGAAVSGCAVLDWALPKPALRTTGWVGRLPRERPAVPAAPPGRLALAQPVTFDAAIHLGPEVSGPAGLLLYVSDRGGNWDLWARPLAGGLAQVLTDGAGKDEQPAVSPGGQWVAFVSNQFDPHGDIYRLALQKTGLEDFQGARQLDRLPRPQAADASPAWLSEDEILFSSQVEGLWRLFRARWPERGAALGPGQARELSKREVRSPALAPASAKGAPRVLAFVAAGGEGPSAVYISLLPDGRQELAPVRASPGAPIEGYPAWGALEEDGTAWLYYARYLDDTTLDGLLDTNDNPSLWRVRVALGASPQVLGPAEPLTEAGAYDVAPKPSPYGLYFTRQEGGQVSVYRLPLSGRAGGLAPTPAQVDEVLRWASPQERILGLRWVGARAASGADPDLPGRCRFEEARAIEEMGNLGAALALYGELASQGESSWARRARLSSARLDSQILQGADLGKNRRQILAAELANYEATLQGLASGGDRELEGQAELELARIEMGMGFPLRALERLSAAEKKFHGVRSVVARARIARAEIHAARGNSRAFQEIILGALREFPAEGAASEEAVERLLAGASDVYPDPRDKVIALRNLAARYEDIPALARGASLWIARLYQKMGQDLAAREEYEYLERASGGEPAMLLEARKGLLLAAGRRGDLAASADYLARIEDSARELGRLPEMESFRRPWAQALLPAAVSRRAAGNKNDARAICDFILDHAPETAEAHAERVALSETPAERRALAGRYEEWLRRGRGPAMAHYGLALLGLADAGSGDLVEILDDHIEPGLAADFRVAGLHQLEGYIHEINESVYGRPGPGWAAALWDTLTRRPARDAGGLPEAVESYRTALFLLSQDASRGRERASLLAALGNTYMAFSPPNYSEAYGYLSARLALGLAFEGDGREFVFREHLSRAAFHVGKPEEAARHASRAAELAERLGLPGEERRMLGYQALCLQEMGQSAEAAALFAKAGEGPGLSPGERVQSLRNVAYNHYQGGRGQEALAALGRARSLIEAPGFRAAGSGRKTLGVSGESSEAAFGFTEMDERRLNYTYTGQVLEDLGDVAGAARFQREKIALYARPPEKEREALLKYWSRLAVAHGRLARLEYSRGDPEGASKDLAGALEAAAQAGDERGRALSVAGLSRLALEEGRDFSPDALSDVIADLEKSRSENRPVDLAVLARLYQNRALAGWIKSPGRSLASGDDGVFRDLLRAEHLLGEAGASTRENAPALRVQVSFDIAAWQLSAGVERAAEARISGALESARRLRMGCLVALGEFLGSALDEARLEDAVAAARESPPALCEALSDRQRSWLYREIYAARAAREPDPWAKIRLFEERLELDLASMVAGEALHFTDPLEEAAWGETTDSLAKARASVEKLWALDRSAAGGEAERNEASLAAGEARGAFEDRRRLLAGKYPALARLVLPVAPTLPELRRALDGARLLWLRMEGGGIAAGWIDSEGAGWRDALAAKGIEVLLGQAHLPFGDWSDEGRRAFEGLCTALSDVAAPQGGAPEAGLYLVAEGALAGLPWGRLSGCLPGRPAVAQLASISHLLAAYEKRNANKRKGLLVAQSGAATEESLEGHWVVAYHERLAREILGLRGAYFTDNGRTDFKKSVQDGAAQYHFLHILSPFTFESGLPLAGGLDFPVQPGEGDGSLPVRELASLGAQANTAVFENTLGSLGEQNLLAFGYLSALGGMPTSILERVSQVQRPSRQEEEFWARFYKAILPEAGGAYLPAGAALADLVAKAGPGEPSDVRLVGLLGLGAAQGAAFAKSHLNELVSGAVAAAQAGDFPRAAGLAEKTVQFLDVAGAPAPVVSQMLGLAAVTLKKSGRTDRAVGYEERQARIQEQAGQLAQLTQTLFFLGQDYSSLGRSSDAADRLLLARDAARKAGRADFEVIVLSELARVREAQGDAREALSRYQEALAIARARGDQAGGEEILYNLGRVAHGSLRDEPSASRYLEEALAAARQLGAAGERNAARDALTLVLVERSRGRLRQALLAADELLPRAARLGDKALWAQGLVYRAVLLLDVGRPQEARGDVEEALALAGGAVGSAGPLRADAQSALALILLKLGDPAGAQKAAEAAGSLAGSPGMESARAAALHNLSLALLEQGGFQAARSAAAEARSLARRLGSKDLEAEEILLEARIGRAMGDAGAFGALLEAVRAFEESGRAQAALTCRLALAEWRANGSAEELDALAREAAGRGRSDLLWRIAFLRGDAETAAAGVLAAFPEPPRQEERWGLDPGRAGEAVRRAVFAKAARGEIGAAHALWEGYRALRRRQMAAEIVPPLTDARGGALVRDLAALWAEGSGLVRKDAADPAALEAVRDAEREAVDALGAKDALTAALLFPTGAEGESRRRELSPGRMILDFAVGGEKALAFVVTQEGERAAWISTEKTGSLGETARAVGEIVLASGRYESRARELARILLEPVAAVLAEKAAGPWKVQVIPDEALSGIPFDVLAGEVPAARAWSFAYRSSLAFPAAGRPGSPGRGRAVLALAEMPPGSVAGLLPPAVRGSPDESQRRLWDEEVFDLLRSARPFFFENVSDLGRAPPPGGAPLLAAHCAALAGGLLAQSVRCGQGVEAGALAAASPEVLFLPWAPLRGRKLWELALWIETLSGGSPLVISPLRHPASGSYFARTFYRELLAGAGPETARSRAAARTCANWPHPADWASFFYYGPME